MQAYLKLNPCEVGHMGRPQNFRSEIFGGQFPQTCPGQLPFIGNANLFYLSQFFDLFE